MQAPCKDRTSQRKCVASAQGALGQCRVSHSCKCYCQYLVSHSKHCEITGHRIGSPISVSGSAEHTDLVLALHGAPHHL
eukprot:1530984-Rhodomonas_salina.3